MEPPVPAVVAESRRATRRYTTHTVLPVQAFVLLWTVGALPAAMVLLDGHPGFAVAVWVFGLLAGIAPLVLATGKMRRHEQVLAEWSRREAARAAFGTDGEAAPTDPMDSVVERIVGLTEDPVDREAVVVARARARELRADAGRAVAAAAALPAGEGATALAAAAERASHEADHLDDQLASIYAMLVARGEPPALAEAIGRLTASSEVEAAARAARAVRSREVG